MIQNSINPNYEKRVAEKYRDAQKYLKANGFIKSTKHLLEDIENTVEKYCQHFIIYRKLNIAMLMGLVPLP